MRFLTSNCWLMPPLMLCVFEVVVRGSWKFRVAVGNMGNGYKFNRARAMGFCRLVGMMLPGNGEPVVGS